MNKAPTSLATLKVIGRIGEAFCRDYGQAVLELVASLGGACSAPVATETGPPEDAR